jgi:hypothetical protein
MASEWLLWRFRKRKKKDNNLLFLKGQFYAITTERSVPDYVLGDDKDAQQNRES